MSDEVVIAEALIDLPEELQALVNEHWPAIQEMSTAEIIGLVEQAIKGKTLEVRRILVARMDNDELLTELDNLIAATAAANDANSVQLARQKEIANKVCLALLSFGLSAAVKYVPLV